MSREQVAEATKIPLALVAAMEDGDTQRLPGHVFVLNFVRSYAQCIGIEPDDAVLRYHEAQGGPVSLEDEPLAVPAPRRVGSVLGGLGAVLLLVTLAVVL